MFSYQHRPHRSRGDAAQPTVQRRPGRAHSRGPGTCGQPRTDLRPALLRSPHSTSGGSVMRVLRVLSVAVGTMLLVVGAAAAIVVGPDDTASLPATTVQGAHVALTDQALFPYRNATLHVAATNTGGSVFVGATNPIDAESYLQGVTLLRVTQVSLADGLGGPVHREAFSVPAVSPETTTFWDESAHGRGEQSIDVSLEGEAISVAVVPVGTAGVVSVSLGVVVPHAF